MSEQKKTAAPKPNIETDPELFAKCFADSLGEAVSYVLEPNNVKEVEAEDSGGEGDDAGAGVVEDGKSGTEGAEADGKSEDGADKTGGRNSEVKVNSNGAGEGATVAVVAKAERAGAGDEKREDGAESGQSAAEPSDTELSGEKSACIDASQGETSIEESSGDATLEDKVVEAESTEGESSEEEPEIPKLRIVFAGMDGRFSTVALQVLAGAHHIVGIIHSQPRRIKQGILADWASRGKDEGNLAHFAEFYGCPFFSTKREYNYELVRFVKHLKPDLICISNFSVILPPSIFEIPTYGAINLHLSSLPTYRGPNPWLWMFYDGCTENEYVVHQVDAGEDTGPILARGSYNIPPKVTCSELADCVLPNAACLMLRVVDDLALGRAKPRPQQTEGLKLRRARYVKPGEALIDWKEWGCERVGAFLLGASLWYEPFTIFPCLVRVYQPGLPGPTQGKPGTNHWRLWHGWISCKDGIVPYRVYIKRYEFWRLFLPIVILLFIAALLNLL